MALPVVRRYRAVHVDQADEGVHVHPLAVCLAQVVRIGVWARARLAVVNEHAVVAFALQKVEYHDWTHRAADLVVHFVVRPHARDHRELPRMSSVDDDHGAAVRVVVAGEDYRCERHLERVRWAGDWGACGMA